MKKMIIILTTLVLSFFLVSCASDNEAEETTGETAENEVAASLTYPDRYEDIEFRVAEGWERIAGDDYLLYNAGYSSMIFGMSETEDGATLVSRVLTSAGFNVNTLEYSGNKEDVELKDITGTKESFTIDSLEGEAFVFTVDNKTYCLVAVFTDPEKQREAFEAIDTLFSSITVVTDPESVIAEEPEGTEPGVEGTEPSEEIPEDEPAEQ